MITKKFFPGLRESCGFTLVETVVVLVILAALSAITFGFAASSAELYRTVSDSESVNGELSVALERMTRELKSAPVITQASGARLAFIDPKKGVCANCVDKSTNIAYRWDEGPANGRLYRLYREGDLSGSRLIADNITGFNVSMAPGGGLITITITKTVGINAVTLTTSVHPDPNIEEVFQ